MKFIIPFNENIQLADKVYFKTNELSEEDKNFILSITNGDNYTKALCDLYINEHPFKRTLKTFKNIYTQLKTYNKNYLPIKDYDINDLTNISVELFTYRDKIIENLNKLPSIAIRNLKSDIRIERDETEFKDFEYSLTYFMSIYLTYVNGKLNPEIKNKINNKLFKNNRTIGELTDFIEEKQNLLGSVKYDYNKFKHMARYEVPGAILIYDKNKILIVKIEEPEAIKIIGENSLWCFTYGSGYHDWDKYSTNEVVYVIVDFNQPQDDPYFMQVLIKPLIWGGELDIDDEEDIDDDNMNKLYDMTNDMIDRPTYIIDSLIGRNAAEELLTFDLE